MQSKLIDLKNTADPIDKELVAEKKKVPELKNQLDSSKTTSTNVENVTALRTKKTPKLKHGIMRMINYLAEG